MDKADIKEVILEKAEEYSYKAAFGRGEGDGYEQFSEYARKAHRLHALLKDIDFDSLSEESEKFMYEAIDKM